MIFPVQKTMQGSIDILEQHSTVNISHSKNIYKVEKLVSRHMSMNIRMVHYNSPNQKQKSHKTTG